MEMFKTRQKLTAASIATLGLFVGGANAATYSTDFEDFTQGTVAGQDGWSVFSAATVEEVTDAAAYSGEQSWRLSNEYASGVVKHQYTPALEVAASEDSIHKRFEASFVFKAVSESGDGSMVQISPDNAAGGRLGGRLDITHVNTASAFDGRTSDLSGLQLHWDTITNNGAEVDTYVSSGSLDPSKWYRVVMSVDFVAGVGPGNTPNDQVSVTVYDTTDDSIAWVVNTADDGISTWETAGYGGDSVDQLTFRQRWQWTESGFVGNVQGVNDGLSIQPQGFYFDDFLVTTSVPEPGSLSLLALGGLTMLRRRRA